MLKILFGTLPAESKFIRIDGKLYDTPYKERDVLSFLPQNGFLPKDLLVEKAVELYLGKKSVETFLNDNILMKLRKNKVASIADGELRYLEIKLLLGLDSKFVLIDEPFSGVSPILIVTIKELIVEASKEKGIILTDHDYGNVLDVSNRYCLIFDGGIKQISDKDELVKWGYISELKNS